MYEDEEYPGVGRMYKTETLSVSECSELEELQYGNSVIFGVVVVKQICTRGLLGSQDTSIFPQKWSHEYENRLLLKYM